MPAPRSYRASSRIPFILTVVALFVLALGPSVTGAEQASLIWVSSDTSLDGVPAPSTIYEGMSGRVLSFDASATEVLVRRGAVRLETTEREVLFVYLVEDAQRAEFEPPARVLSRHGHEVVIAMQTSAEGDVPSPRLTMDSEAGLRGLRQPVRLSGAPIAQPAETPQEPLGMREFDPRIQEMVDDLTSTHFMGTWQALDDFETRYVYAPENDAATQWILEQFQSFGLEAEFHYYTQDGQQKRNVIATHPGVADPSRVVYICAHLDAITGTPYDCAPGADDNGSGTAAVIEAARVMSQYPFEYTVKFACWNGEEQGLIGSSAYAALMAQQGEDIVGVYNCDMIAYRGTDPAPADLVIYTNSASQSLATTLADAVQYYTPGLLDPIVLVESMSGSDHYSFWTQGYRAVCSIEDAAWGSDFCPWYHTCNDRIEQYPTDYVLNCTKANLAAAAMTALVVTSDGPYLVLGSLDTDDDTQGGSNGNGDGEPNPGETIELWVTVRNIGAGDATGVTGQLASQSGYVTLLDTSSAWDDIPSGGECTNLTAFRFTVDGTTPDGQPLPLSLTLTDDQGVRELNLSLVAAAPELAYWFHRIDDSAGNGNGVPDPGEPVELPVWLSNQGGQDAAGVTATLTCADPRVTIMVGESNCDAIPSGAKAELSPAYRVVVPADASEGEVFSLDLAVEAGTGYQCVTAFPIRVGAAFFDQMEAAGAWSLADPDDDATTGRWIRVDPIGTESNGQPCQPEDDHTSAPGTHCFVTGQGTPGGAAGDADIDGGKTTLTSPAIDLSAVDQPRLTYWRWYSNDLGNSPSEDYWVAQVSSDGGASWVDLERTTQSQNAWTERNFLLTDFIVPSDQVQIRFVASDEGSGSLVEAAVDDLTLTGLTSPVAVEDPLPTAELWFEQIAPNPARGAAMLTFALPAPGDVRLSIFGVDGRLVRALVDGELPAGVHREVWDGRTDGGRTVAPGIYFCRLESDDRVLIRRLTLVH